MEKRHLERVSLPRHVLAGSTRLGFSDRVALLRDISDSGAFFFTVLPLKTGDVVDLLVRTTDAEGSLSLSFTGTVIRIEKGPTANKIGVAVTFSSTKVH